MAALAWLILAFVFVDEVAAVVALGVFGWWLTPSWLWVWLLPLVGVVLWSRFASPKAPYGGAVARPVAKLLVFGAGVVGLWLAGDHGWAVALLVFSIVINALVFVPFVQAEMARQRAAD